MACALCASELQTPVLRAPAYPDHYRLREERRFGREQIQAIAAAVAED